MGACPFFKRFSSRRQIQRCIDGYDFRVDFPYFHENFIVSIHQGGLRIHLFKYAESTARGINLRNVLEAENFVAVEAYPGGAQDVLRIPRKQKGLEKLRAGLESLGIKRLNSQMSHHELDAVTCAYVGKLFLEGNAVIYGAPDDGIVMPKGEIDRPKKK
jgi:predicted RNase H-like nuclease